MFHASEESNVLCSTSNPKVHSLLKQHRIIDSLGMLCACVYVHMHVWVCMHARMHLYELACMCVHVICMKMCVDIYWLIWRRLAVSACILWCMQTLFTSYLCLLIVSIGHRPKNATVFCPWPSSPSLSWCNPSILFLSLYFFARCIMTYLFASSLRGSMWWLDGLWFLEVSWVCVLSTSIFSSWFHFLCVDSCLVIFQSVVLDLCKHVFT